jgi:hypothetical protein
VRIRPGGDPSRELLLEKPILNVIEHRVRLPIDGVRVLIDHLSSLRSKFSCQRPLRMRDIGTRFSSLRIS